jgi:hypothetical protein
VHIVAGNIDGDIRDLCTSCGIRRENAPRNSSLGRLRPRIVSPWFIGVTASRISLPLVNPLDARSGETAIFILDESDRAPHEMHNEERMGKYLCASFS